jgi:tetratricopeptide (TPR) repeat protein
MKTVRISERPKPASRPRAGRRLRDAIRTPRQQVVAAVAVVIVFVLAGYANSLSNGFVFDDRPIILDNRLLRSLANLPHLLTASYRPLRDISHAIDFALWGERAAGFHLTNVLIHLANSLLVFALVRRLMGGVIAALIAALVFALHPLQPDAVAYVSGRRDVLFSLFYLAGFHCYLTYRSHRRVVWLALFVLCWALSLMAKEMAATLPAVIFLWNFCAAFEPGGGHRLKRFIRAARAAFSRDRWLYMALAAGAVAYAWFMIFVKGGSVLARDGFKYWGGSFTANLLLALRVQAWYLKQLVWPTPFVQYKGTFDIVTSFWDWRVIVAVFAVGAVLAGGLWALDRHRLAAFAVLSYFVLLLPVSQIVPHHELAADHYLYLPLMSFALLAAVVCERLAARGLRAKQMVYATVAIVVLAFAAMTVFRNRVWKDDLTLWQTNYQEAPDSIRAVSSLAKAYATTNPGRAEALYRRCIEVDPTYGPAYYSLALLCRSRDKAREAEALVRAGLLLPDEQVANASQGGAQEVPPFRAMLTTALALTRLSQDDRAQGEGLLWQALATDPRSPPAYGLLVSLYRDSDKERALAVLKQQAVAFTDRREPLEQLVAFLTDTKQYDDALVYLGQLRRLVPNDYYCSQQLSRVYRAKGDCAQAWTYLDEARTLASSTQEEREAQRYAGDLQQDCRRP